MACHHFPGFSLNNTKLFSTFFGLPVKNKGKNKSENSSDQEKSLSTYVSKHVFRWAIREYQPSNPETRQGTPSLLFPSQEWVNYIHLGKEVRNERSDINRAFTHFRLIFFFVSSLPGRKGLEFIYMPWLSSSLDMVRVGTWKLPVRNHNSILWHVL